MEITPQSITAPITYGQILLKNQITRDNLESFNLSLHQQVVRYLDEEAIQIQSDGSISILPNEKTYGVRVGGRYILNNNPGLRFAIGYYQNYHQYGGVAVALTLGDLLELPEAKIYRTDGEEVPCIYASIPAGTKIPVKRI